MAYLYMSSGDVLTLNSREKPLICDRVLIPGAIYPSNNLSFLRYQCCGWYYPLVFFLAILWKNEHGFRV
jgi:hypothetical protein